MIEPQAKLLAYLAAGGTLATYNLETVRTLDLPAEDVRQAAKAMGVLQRWQDAVLSGQLPEALATHVMRTLAAFDSYQTINPASPTFGAVLEPIRAAGLLTDAEIGQLVAMAIVVESQRLADGWAHAVGVEDVIDAKQEAAREALTLAIDADYNRWWDAQAKAANATRNARIDKLTALVEPLPETTDAAALLAWLDGRG